MSKRVLAAFAALFVVVPLVSAQELKGAKSVLDKVLEAPKVASGAKAEFEARVKSFATSSASMTPTAAAKEWVSLLMEAMASDAESMYGGGGVANRIWAILPSPETWSSIRSNVRALTEDDIDPKQKQQIEFVFSLLLADRAGQTSIMNSWTKDIDPDVEESMMQGYQVLAIYKQWAEFTRDKQHVKKALLLSYSREGFSEGLLPEIVMILDPADREEVAKAYFSTVTYTYLDPDMSEEFKEFFRDMAVKYGQENEAIVWMSLGQIGAHKQFEAYAKSSGYFKTLVETDTLSRSDIEYMNNTNFAGEALGYYITSLILLGDATKAERILANNATTLQDQVKFDVGNDETLIIDQMEKIAVSLSRVLALKPTASYWTDFAQFAARSARGDLLVSTAEKAISSGSLTPARRVQVNTALATGYLGLDRVDEAIKLLFEAVDQSKSLGQSGQYETYTMGYTLVALGTVMKRDELIDKGINLLDGGPVSEYMWYSGDVIGQTYLELGRYAEAEDRLSQALVKLVSSDEAQYTGYSGAEDLLISLVQVYHRTGRSEDVLYLLKNAPYWPWDDLSEATDQSLLVAAATALSKTGQRNAALAIVEQMLPTAGGNDRVYELYVELAGANAIAGLDNVFSLDEFEERPLIWKAKVLLDQNKLAEAETVARQAIAIDPSDGEQGKGDRMRVYAVLSAVLAKRGQAEQAQVYANAVRAIRMSENADDFYAAGMTKRAIEMYSEALTVFQDAYCIQSRLAIQLLESGDPEGAAVHFRKAFELMPDSFGRIESHCFGCEGIFSSPQAQDIALSVLQQLLKDRADKPQVHYLMGYLLKSRSQTRDAIPHFEKAVQLDAKYLNAWIELSDAYAATNAPAPVSEKAAFAIAQLDPLGRHTSYRAREAAVTDFAQLWRVGNDQFLKTPTKPDTMFELSASKDFRESEEGRPQRDYGYEEANGPASLLMQNSLIQAAVRMIAGDYYGY